MVILLCGLEKIDQKGKKKEVDPLKLNLGFPFGTALGFAYFMYLKSHEIG